VREAVGGLILQAVGWLILLVLVLGGMLIYNPQGFRKSFANISGMYHFTQHDLGDCYKRNNADVKISHLTQWAEKIERFCIDKYSTELPHSSLSLIKIKMGPSFSLRPQFSGSLENNSEFLITKLNIAIPVSGRVLEKSVTTWVAPGDTSAVYVPLSAEEAALFGSDLVNWNFSAEGIRVELS
jgi:hypothetical protein